MLVSASDVSTYTGGVYNTADFNNYLNIFLIKLMTSMDSCSYTSFMVYVNNRMNDYSFLGGMLANLATQLALI